MRSLIWTDGLAGLFPPVAELGLSPDLSEKPLLLSGLASEPLDLRHDRRPPEGPTASLGGALLAREAVGPVGGWGSTSDLLSRPEVAHRSGAAPRAVFPVPRFLTIWVGAGLLVFVTSCTPVLAPVVRCVPDSVVLGCK